MVRYAQVKAFSQKMVQSMHKSCQVGAGPSIIRVQPTVFGVKLLRFRCSVSHLRLNLYCAHNRLVRLPSAAAGAREQVPRRDAAAPVAGDEVMAAHCEHVLASIRPGKLKTQNKQKLVRHEALFGGGGRRQVDDSGQKV